MSSRAGAERAVNNYERYWAAPCSRPDHYPIGATPDPARYRPIGAWLGRLILPAPHERAAALGALIELHHAPEAHAALVGTVARLRWAPTLPLNARFWGATRSVHFDEDAREAAQKGTVLGERLDGREHVNPFESLAGAHPHDDICVRLQGEVRLVAAPDDGGAPILFVTREPAQVTGRFYGLVTFLGPAGEGDGYRVRHYDRAAGAFAGPEEVVRLPEVLPDGNGTRNSTATGIERSPCNGQGWYIYGALDAAGQFVVRALAPRQLLRLEPELYCDRTEECMAYLKPKAWREAGSKGQATVALLCGDGVTPHGARAAWAEGERGLLIHLFGGIGGENAEPAAKTPLYWGHFAFGEAVVVREPLADELQFDIVYQQVYAHNEDGLTAGALHYSRYAGDRQYGWLGARPIQDLIFRLDSLTGAFQLDGRPISAFDVILGQLEVMTARYRIADGRGGTRVGALNNCAQDSAQALYAAISGVGRAVRGRGGVAEALAATPEDERRLADLRAVGRELRAVLVPWGSARADWEYGIPVLGGASPDGVLGNLGKAMSSWRTMLPPVAARAIAEVFFKAGASAWALRTYQAGGDDPSIEPYVPNV
ncbi:MAG TPA: hypothetical protein PKD53_07595 [Chloroflexaceae bacterium]|nr:hypothetical protein [Chloroflexaceae bacterium]